MKNKAPLLLHLLPIFFFTLLSASIFGQSNFSIDQNQLQPFVTHLDCEYGDQIHIPNADIKAFFQNLVTNATTTCNALEPSISVNLSTKLRFEWPGVPGSQGYRVASLGLGDGTSQTVNTTAPKAGFQNLSPQLYLFAFLNNCSTTSSSFLEIIIVDKDLSLVPYYVYDDFCYCDEKDGKQKRANEDCTDGYEALFIPWNNTCDANRYHFAISEDGTEDEKEIYIISEELGDQQSLYVLRNCGGFEYSEESYTILDDNYSAILTSSGIHFYPELEEGNGIQVTRTDCGCYTKPIEHVEEEKGNGRNAAPNELLRHALQVNPNPFNDFLYVDLGEKSDLPTDILIFDLNGRLVHQSTQASETGIFSIATETLGLGIYQLILRNTQKTWQQKIIKMK